MRITGAILFLVGAINFLAFGIHSMMIGGSAGNGGRRDGRYYVSEHGKEVEVSEEVFKMSALHGRSILVTHVLGMIGVVMLGSEKFRFVEKA